MGGCTKKGQVIYFSHIFELGLCGGCREHNSLSFSEEELKLTHRTFTQWMLNQHWFCLLASRATSLLSLSPSTNSPPIGSFTWSAAQAMHGGGVDHLARSPDAVFFFSPPVPPSSIRFDRWSRCAVWDVPTPHKHSGQPVHFGLVDCLSDSHDRQVPADTANRHFSITVYSRGTASRTSRATTAPCLRGNQSRTNGFGRFEDISLLGTPGPSGATRGEGTEQGSHESNTLDQSERGTETESRGARAIRS